MNHFGHPLPQPPSGATPGELAAWYRQGAPLSDAMEAHLDAWLLLERLRLEYPHAGPDRRREMREEAEGYQATIDRIEHTHAAQRAA